MASEFDDKTVGTLLEKLTTSQCVALQELVSYVDAKNAENLTTYDDSRWVALFMVMSFVFLLVLTFSPTNKQQQKKQANA